MGKLIMPQTIVNGISVETRNVDTPTSRSDVDFCVRILPYKIGAYDELESVFFEENLKGSSWSISDKIKEGVSPVQACVDLLKSSTGFLVENSDRNRISPIKSYFISKNSNEFVFPFLINVSKLNRSFNLVETSENSKVIEVDTNSVLSYNISDLNLHYLFLSLYNLK